jgi:putative membrane protein
MDSVYDRFRQDELILRDELAIDRTLLANERTLLAYLRGGVSLLLAGVTFIHFSQHGWFTVLGILCLPAGAWVTALGVTRYTRMDRAIRVLRRGSRPADGTGSSQGHSTEEGGETDGV